MQKSLNVDKGVNLGIMSVGQQTFKSVEEGLSFFNSDG